MPQPSGRIRSYWTLALLLLTAAWPAHAQVWNEVGDAGDLIATAQATVGGGPLVTLNGTLSSPADVDVYCITAGPAPRIPGLPIASLQCVVMQGPNIWMFDANGVGVATNETCSGGMKALTTSTVPAGGQGTFYVAVSYYGLNPVAAAGPIWLPAVGGERTPDGPGAAGALTGWAGMPVVQPINPYQITFGYTSFCSGTVSTAPSTWSLVKAFYRQ
jgi:hypothetical protein